MNDVINSLEEDLSHLVGGIKRDKALDLEYAGLANDARKRVVMKGKAAEEYRAAIKILRRAGQS